MGAARFRNVMKTTSTLAVLLCVLLTTFDCIKAEKAQLGDQGVLTELPTELIYPGAQNTTDQKHGRTRNKGAPPEGCGPSTPLGDFEILHTLGKGLHGYFFEGRHISTGQEVGIKMESALFPKLYKEVEIYADMNGKEGFVKVWFNGTINNCNVLIIDLLGLSLEDVKTISGGKLSLNTTLMLGLQMITLLEKLHDKGYIHRDVRPDNFLLGLENHDAEVYLIDYGLTQRFRDRFTGEHRPFGPDGFGGTRLFASVAAHLEVTQGRKDDLESLGYVLLYLMNHTLPWDVKGIDWGSVDVTLIKRNVSGDMKIEMDITTLCKGLPPEFVEYFEYVKSLPYAKRPNYDYLRSLFRNRMDLEGMEDDRIYDWMLMTPEELEKAFKTGQKKGVKRARKRAAGIVGHIVQIVKRLLTWQRIPGRQQDEL